MVGSFSNVSGVGTVIPNADLEGSGLRTVVADMASPMEWRSAAEASGSFNAELTIHRFSFPPEWEADRQEAIRLLQGLPRATQDADRALRLIEELRRTGMGGNLPPDELAPFIPANDANSLGCVDGIPAMHF